MESKDWSGFRYFSPDFSPGMSVSQRIWTPLRRFGPPHETFLLSILSIILGN